jgi:hypothetical protein
MDLAGDPALPLSNLYHNQRLRNVKLVRDDQPGDWVHAVSTSAQSLDRHLDALTAPRCRPAYREAPSASVAPSSVSGTASICSSSRSPTLENVPSAQAQSDTGGAQIDGSGALGIGRLGFHSRLSRVF